MHQRCDAADFGSTMNFFNQILFYSIFDTFQFHEKKGNELLISNKQEIIQGNVQIIAKFCKKGSPPFPSSSIQVRKN